MRKVITFLLTTVRLFAAMHLMDFRAALYLQEL